jgi:hypothetical protein
MLKYINQCHKTFRNPTLFNINISLPSELSLSSHIKTSICIVPYSRYLILSKQLQLIPKPNSTQQHHLRVNMLLLYGRLWDHVEKHGTAGQAIDDKIARGMRKACRILYATDTHSEYVTLVTFTLNVTLYVYFLSSNNLISSALRSCLKFLRIICFMKFPRALCVSNSLFLV